MRHSASRPRVQSRTQQPRRTDSMTVEWRGGEERVIDSQRDSSVDNGSLGCEGYDMREE